MTTKTDHKKKDREQMIELDKVNVKLAQQKVNLQNSAIRNHNINIR